MPLGHERAFAAQAHEARRLAPRWPAHELRTQRALHESRSEARVAALPGRVAGSASAQREPRLGRRHDPSRSVRGGSAVDPARTDAPAGLVRHTGEQAQQAADHGRGRQRASIHARHEQRVRRQRQLQHWHLELRRWRETLRQRAKLLRKLALLERRLAASSAAVAGRGPAVQQLYEIDGVWFHQAGRRRPSQLRLGST